MSTLRQAVADLLDPDGPPVEAAADRHFAPGFRQRADGTWLDRPAFLERMRGLRAAAERIDVRVLDELADGARYAERHVIDIALRDGTRVRREVLVFATRDADGRFLQIDEATVEPDDEGSARPDGR
jgi:hypothetical protein